MVRRPFLNTGITRAAFHSNGNWPNAIDLLKIFVNDCATAGAAIWRTLMEILSRSTDLDTGNFVISL